MLPSFIFTALSHVLNGESWARKRLQPHAGKTIQFAIFSSSDLVALIQSDGKITAIPFSNTTATANTSLTIPPSLLLRLIARDASAIQEINISGDKLLADELLTIIRSLHWDIEHDLSPFLGDILAHRLTQAGQTLLRWQSQSLLNVSQAMIEYLSEEKPILSNQANIEHFVAEINTLNEQVTHLEKRIDTLNSSLASAGMSDVTLQTGSKETS